MWWEIVFSTVGYRIIKPVIFRKKYGLAKNTVSRKFYGKAPASHLPVLYRKNDGLFFTVHAMY